jgi:hypothetical protein
MCGDDNNWPKRKLDPSTRRGEQVAGHPRARPRRRRVLLVRARQPLARVLAAAPRQLRRHDPGRLRRGGGLYTF